MPRFARFFINLLLGIAILTGIGIAITFSGLDIETPLNRFPFLRTMFKMVPLVVIGLCWVLSEKKQVSLGKNDDGKRERTHKENLAQLVAEGKARDVTDEMVCVNLLYDSLLDSAGSDDPVALLDSMTKGFVERQEFWRIGEQISKEAYSEFVDKESGELYGVSRLTDGKKHTQLILREVWECSKKAIVSL